MCFTHIKYNNFTATNTGKNNSFKCWTIFRIYWILRNWDQKSVFGTIFSANYIDQSDIHYLFRSNLFKSWTIKLRSGRSRLAPGSGPHSKLKADENSTYLPGYSMKNSRKHSFHRNPFKSRGLPHASQNGICRPEMCNFHIMSPSCF